MSLSNTVGNGESDMKRNLILITLDEVRPDHLSCYGYDKMKTANIDRIAEEGVLFETCITASNFTPVSHASILTGVYPNKHGTRDAYSPIQRKSIAEILKEQAFATAAYVGNPVLSIKLDFNKGFDHYEEQGIEDPLHGAFKIEVAQGEKIELHQVRKGGRGTFGNWWIERAIDWIKKQSNQFFLWGHVFDTHRVGEKRMFYNRWIKPGELSDFDYYDAKIKCVDERFIGLLIKALKDLGIYDDTTLVLMSDHGTNLADHPIPLGSFSQNWALGPFPEHSSLYDHDIRAFCIMKDRDLPKGRRVKGIVRTVDITPTILDLLGIRTDVEFDGVSLIPFIEKGESTQEEAYVENMWEDRVPGLIQALRGKRYKLIRNLSAGVEALYDLENDPKEASNMLCNVDGFTLPEREKEELLRNTRRKLNEMISRKEPITEKAPLKGKEREEIDKRLRQLGYLG